MRQRTIKRIVIVQRPRFGRGLGDTTLGKLGPMLKGDKFEFGVELTDLGPTVGPIFQQGIADPMNASGKFRDVTAYQIAGFFNPFIVVAGAVNQDFASGDDVKNLVLSYVQAKFQGFQGWVGHVNTASIVFNAETRNAQEPSKVEPVYQGAPRGDGGTTPPPSADQLAQQQYCAQLGLVYNKESGKCECGWLDQLAINLGLKKTCQESVINTPTSLALGAGLLVIGLVVLNKVTK